jgi:hypothetical protein
MFGNLFNNAINTVKSLLSSKATPPSKPKATAVVQKPITKTYAAQQKLPSYSPYIAAWGDSPAKIKAGTANNDVQLANTQKAIDANNAARAAADAENKRRIAQDIFDKNKGAAKGKAQQAVNAVKNRESGNPFSWLTGGFTSDQAAREFAANQSKNVQDSEIKKYDSELNKFLKAQATKKAEIEKKKFGSQTEFDAAVGVFSKWESAQIASLEKMRATTTGTIEAYDSASQKESNSWLGQFGGAIKKTIVDPIASNAIFKYTLGSGDENMPSLVTAPSRGVNFFGNLFNQQGNKNLQDGTWVKGYQPGKNAWTQTYNQRNINMELPKKYSDKDFEAWYKTRNTSGWADTDPKKVKEMYRRAFKGQLEGDEMANNVTEFLMDPLLGAGKAAGAIGKTATLAGEAAKTTKAGSFVTGILDKVAQSKPVKWLGAEHKDFNARKNEFIEQEVADIKRKQPMVAGKVDEWLNNSAKMRATAKAEISKKVLANFGDLSRVENRTVQELLRAGGDWSLVKYADKFDDAGRAKIDDLVAKIRANTDDLLAKEKAAGIATPKRINYIPQYRRKYSLFGVKDKLKKRDDGSSSDWWFTKEQKQQVIQSRGSFRKSLSAREFSSKLARQDFPILQSIKAGHADIGENIKRIQEVNQHVKKTRWEKMTTPLSWPNKLWKKSVLKYNPAWTVNNIAYNVPASVMAGGVRALPETVRLLKKSNWEKAMKEIPDAVKTNLAKEIGSTGKVNKFYDRVENTSRVAAYRANKSKGMSDEAAVKRVNKYLFDYKTRNYERPIKSILPFYQWNKNLARVSATMPIDRPLAAKVYNEVDQYQNTEFDRQFEKVVPKLTELGYSEQEIQKIKADQAKYFKGRLKVGDKWVTTPFNPLSDSGLSNVGFNPYLMALIESGAATDSFGNKTKGTDAGYFSRLRSKFPQVVLGEKAAGSYRVATGADHPGQKWIGAAGGDGYGLTKGKQGSDSSKPNYDRSMDPRAKLGQDALAFVGVPRALDFDTDKLVESKRLQKVSEAYFALDTKNMDYPTQQAAQAAIFKKYGVTPDQFYKGVLAKYDSANTTRIKGLKESAATANKSLFDEYAAQPQGTRNLWATQKLRELNDQNYFADNPFKKSFGWINPTTVAKADKQALASEATRTGDWSKYRAKFGTGTRSAKALARDKAVRTGDWTEYAKTYGVTKKTTPFQFDGKYFKSAESMQKYQSGQFWKKYASADPDTRKTLLADNPQFNQRANWTDQMWRTWKSDKKRKEITKARGWGNFAALQDANAATARVKANKFLTARTAPKTKRLTRA